MITGQELLDRLSAQFEGSFERRFAFPFTYVSVVSSELPAGDAEREEFVAEQVGLDVPTLRALCNRLFIRIEPRRPDEPDERPVNRGEFWMRALQAPSNPAVSTQVPAVHFYGFKGGQTRSTLLAFLSMALALDGWRVLAVDMDAEAPSLDVIYGVSATDMASTVIGLRAGLPAQPVRAFTPPSGNGYTDLLPLRPLGALYDLDAAALTMELSIHPQGQQGIIDALLPIASGYDIVLVDHRTGLAPTVLPWIAGLPGPVVVFARMDGQWRGAQRHLLPLWRGHVDQPGLLVSAIPPEVDETTFIREEQDQATELIEELATVYRTRDAAEDEIDASDLLDHWVLWPYDPALIRAPVPEPGAVGGPVQARIADIRRLLDLTGRKAHESIGPKLDPSGSRDEGHLIQTKALRQLSTPNNPYTFILGRKGTGKTRLVRALTYSNLGEPLLVASDFPEEAGGLVRDTLLDQVADGHDQPEAFWWLLIAVALQGDTSDRAALRRRLQELHRGTKDPIDQARSAAAALTKARVFFIDGLETSFSRERTFPFLGALFRVIAAIEADPDFRDRVRVKIFVRTDLAQRGFENFEQQSHGRRLELAWDTQSILNFALSRIERLRWFDENFPDATQEVRGRLDELKEGAVSTEGCDRFLMRYFPHRLGHANINTTTFLRTWFSDDPKAETSFYPRVYDGFLRFIAEKDKRSSYLGPELENERLAQSLIYYAHSRSTEDFLQQVKSELLNIVDLTESQLTDLLDAMKGTITPFVLEKRVKELAQHTGLMPPQVRQAMERMKRLGIFEDRPKFPGQWRVGRLFKSSLKMIYDRKRRDPTELSHL